MSGIIGTLRISLFLVPVSGSLLTVIWHLTKSQSPQVILAASVFLNPPQARKRTKSAQGFENRLPPFSSSVRNLKNCSGSGSASSLRLTLARRTACMGLSGLTPASAAICRTRRAKEITPLTLVAEYLAPKLDRQFRQSAWVIFLTSNEFNSGQVLWRAIRSSSCYRLVLGFISVLFPIRSLYIASASPRVIFPISIVF